MGPPTARSEYLPQSRLHYFLRRIITSAAYRVWRRKLGSLAEFRRNEDRALLEIGCGPGYFLRRAERWFPGFFIVGSDLDLASLRFAARRTRQARFFQADAAALPIRPASIDAICAFQVLEHLPKPEAFLEDAGRALKQDGILLLATPNPAGLAAVRLKDRWQGIRRDHVSLRSPEDWSKALGAAGFRLLDWGTTGLTGFPLLKWPPFAFLNWVPMTIFGYFPWRRGESFMAICRKEPRR